MGQRWLEAETRRNSRPSDAVARAARARSRLRLRRPLHRSRHHGQLLLPALHRLLQIDEPEPESDGPSVLKRKVSPAPVLTGATKGAGVVAEERSDDARSS